MSLARIRLLSYCGILLAVGLSSCGTLAPAPSGKEAPRTENLPWEDSCGGSNIAVTTLGGQIVSIDAEAEHFAEGRRWQCHFVNGGIVSARYSHTKLTRHLDEQGSFTIEAHEDQARTFHFPNHRIEGIEPGLKKDLLEVLHIAGAD